MLQDVPIIVRLFALGILASAIWLTHALHKAQPVDANNQPTKKPGPPPGIGHSTPQPRTHRNQATWMAYIRLQLRKISNNNK